MKILNSIYPIYFKGSLLILMAALTPCFISCDDVDEADRYIKVDPPTEDPDPEGPGTEDPKVIPHKVLIQEFTGQGCINCPQGAAIVHSLQSQNPGSIIAVNLHPENTQYTRPLGNIKLTSPLATVYYNYYRPASFPSACINGSTPVSNISLWTNEILTAAKLESAADLNLTTEYDPATRNLKVTYDSRFVKAFNSPLNINIWIMENGIVGPQFSGSNILLDYIHNHVLRTSLTGDWGVSMANSFAENDKFNASFTIKLDDSWVAENCEVIAFLQNPSSKNVEQAAEAPVISENE